jgi:glycosyltransferase involved in cell wall biosynthesis
MRISVALCTYNGEKFLKEQIDSILNQSLKVDEIIVCDDISKDNTLSLLEKYSNNNPNLFKIYKNKINLKSVKNFEKAISLCSGDIIFLSDQDDIWLENKVEDYVNYFNNNPNINVLASNGYCIDQDSNVHEKYAFWDAPQFLRDLNIDIDYFKIITHVSNIATGASMALRKSIVSDILPFPLINNFHHDEWIAMISSLNNSFELLNEKYFYYRIHENQQVGSVFFEKNETFKRNLIHLFSMTNKNISFKVSKKRLRKLYTFCKLCQILIDDNNQYVTIFAEKLKITKEYITIQRKQLLKEFPLKARILFLSDFILNKRQLTI